MAKIAVKGLDKLLKQFDQFGEDAKEAAGTKLSAGAKDIAADARANAPGNLGDLRKFTQPKQIDDLRWEVISAMPYAGYVEFGTGVKVSVPSELKEVAQSIKNNPKSEGPGTALDAIQDWCKQKGIDERAAWPILMSILNEGLRPRPFLYPAWKEGSEKLEKQLEKALDKEVNKFNSKK